jgi:thiamine-phosphate pyrophosphorylase
MNIHALRLCLVTHPHHYFFENYEQFILQAIRGGITSVQLRNKTSQPMMHTLALALISLLRPLKIPLIINDNIDLAKEVDADGVHLGQSDRKPFEARQILGPDKIIGWSIETYEQLKEANQLQCIDYIAASAVFPSKTKPDCKTIWGFKGLKKITKTSIHPVVAIGGINKSNIRKVIGAGACGAAVISAIHDHTQPGNAAQELMKEINQGEFDV